MTLYPERFPLFNLYCDISVFPHDIFVSFENNIEFIENKNKYFSLRGDISVIRVMLRFVIVRGIYRRTFKWEMGGLLVASINVNISGEAWGFAR